MQLPVDRIIRAGATPEEATQLEAEFNASPVEAQNSQVTWFAGVAETQIREWVAQLRANGHFGDEIPTPSESEAEQVAKQLGLHKATGPKPRRRSAAKK